jgi:hypothetical protein
MAWVPFSLAMRMFPALPDHAPIAKMDDEIVGEQRSEQVVPAQLRTVGR